VALESWAEAAARQQPFKVTRESEFFFARKNNQKERYQPMFKNLSVWLYEKSMVDDLATEGEALMRNVLRHKEMAFDLLDDNPPTNPDFGQFKKSGLLPLDDLLVDQALTGPGLGRFLPLTQVIRERVVDSGAVKFEVAQRVKHIFTMENRRCNRKEIQGITDEVIFSMLKDAPIREKRVQGILMSSGEILVNATGKTAEDYISYIKSLFNNQIIVRTASLGTWNSDLELDASDFDCINTFARELIINGDPDDEDVELAFIGSFKFNGTNESFTVERAKEQTIDGLADRIVASDLEWIGVAHKHAVFKLTSDLTLKSIKLQDLDYVPEDDQEVGITSAYYRFYISFFSKLFDTIVHEVAAASIEEDDNV
jgi:hypothetical protein